MKYFFIAIALLFILFWNKKESKKIHRHTAPLSPCCKAKSNEYYATYDSDIELNGLHCSLCGTKFYL